MGKCIDCRYARVATCDKQIDKYVSCSCTDTNYQVMLHENHDFVDELCGSGWAYKYVGPRSDKERIASAGLTVNGWLIVGKNGNCKNFIKAARVRGA